MSQSALTGRGTVKPGEIRSLTGLRGAAALMVVAYHYAASYEPTFYKRVATGPGYLSVDLFFILSGFVMALTYGKRFAGPFRWNTYKGFLEARFARVYPLYAIATLVLFVLGHFGVPHLGNRPWPVLASNLLSAQELGLPIVLPATLGNLDDPAWSISVEAGAYLIFPLLAALALFRKQWMAIGVAAAGLLAVCVIAALPDAALHEVAGRRGPLDVYSGATLWPLVKCVAEFSIGLVTYRAYKAWQPRRGVIWDVVTLGALAALWCIPGSDVLIVALFPLLVFQICTDASPLARALGAQPAYFFGEISFSLYLVHQPAMAICFAVLPWAQRHHVPHAFTLSLMLALCLTIPLAWLTFSWIEKPARNALRWLFDRPRRAIETEPPAP